MFDFFSLSLSLVPLILLLRTPPPHSLHPTSSGGSDSDSNSDGDGNGSEKKKRKSGGAGGGGDGDATAVAAALGSLDAEKTPLKLTTKDRTSVLASANHGLADCSPLNLQVIKPTGVAMPTIVTSAGALTYHSSPSSSYSLGSTPPGTGHRAALHQTLCRHASSKT